MVVPQPRAAKPKAPVKSVARKEGLFIGIPRKYGPRIALSQRLQKVFPSRVKIGFEGGQQVTVDQGADG